MCVVYHCSTALTAAVRLVFHSLQHEIPVYFFCSDMASWYRNDFYEYVTPHVKSGFCECLLLIEPTADFSRVVAYLDPSWSTCVMKCKSTGSLVATFWGTNNLRHPYNFIVYCGGSFPCSIQIVNDISTRSYISIYTGGYPRIKHLKCNRQV